MDHFSVNIVSRKFKGDPFPFYASLRAKQPVCCVKISGFQKAWLVTQYDEVLRVLKDNRFAKDRRNALAPKQHDSSQGLVPNLSVFARLRQRIELTDVGNVLRRNMLDLDDPDHNRLRGLVHRAFTPLVIEGLRARVHSISDQLLDAVQHRGSMDLIGDFAKPLTVTMVSELLGIPPKDRHHFQGWSKVIVKAPTRLNQLRALPAIRSVMHYLRQLLSEAPNTSEKGLLAALVEAQKCGCLSEDELIAMTFLLIISGYETTVTLIASGMLALLQQPDQLELLRANPSLIQSAIEELLRFTSPLESATQRYTREDVTLAGVTIPRGSLVLAVIASANRDESQFERPDQLDITRKTNRHLAFGLGAHFCLGAPLARLEGQIAIATIARRFPHLRLAVPVNSLRWRATPILRSLEAMPVLF